MVKKIFTTLGIVVGCMVVIAFALNVILPNGMNGISNAIETGIYNATGVELDINGDGQGGNGNSSNVIDGSNDKASQGVGVNGFN